MEEEEDKEEDLEEEEEEEDDKKDKDKDKKGDKKDKDKEKEKEIEEKHYDHISKQMLQYFHGMKFKKGTFNTQLKLPLNSKKLLMM